MFTHFLATAASVYGVLGALKTLLQTRQMLARRTSSGASAGFLASYAGGYAIWLTYGLSTGNWALGRGFDLPDLDVHRPTLEDVYLSLTGSTSAKAQR
jgi:uncharacterized protein with PQ loop repeat